jgi:hypothetical protein
MNRSEIAERSERNRLGQIVVTIEQHRSLEITTMEKLMTAYPNMTDQITHLEARLTELGGPELIAAEFCFDDGPSFKGFHTGTLWNGWAMPCFTKEVCDEIIAWFNDNKGEAEEPDSIYDAEKDAYLMGFDVFYAGNQEEIEHSYWKKAAKTGLYPLGAGSYTWSVAE